MFQHSALLDIDNDTSFFGVFDGHGGMVTCREQLLFFTHDFLNIGLKQTST